MITLNKISFGQLKPLIELSYQGDNELFEKYHLGLNMTEEDCVNAQMVMIKQAAVEVDVDYYKVIFDKKPIGYLVTFPNVLYSFAINKNFRKHNILKDFFEGIKNVLGIGFICVLYKNNTRAIEYLVKCGMQLEENHLNNNTVNLKYI